MTSLLRATVNFRAPVWLAMIMASSCSSSQVLQFTKLTGTQIQSICIASRQFSFPRQTNLHHLSLSKGNCTSFAATTSPSPVKLVDVGTNAATEDGVLVSSITTESGLMKMKFEVSGVKAEAIFDEVFSKMVAAAQPIPGFRRVKGGKTPNIPKDVLIQVLGPSKVYKQVITKVINSTVAEYVEREKLIVTKDLKVEQSYEELEAAFEPGEEFSFDVTLQLRNEDV